METKMTLVMTSPSMRLLTDSVLAKMTYLRGRWLSEED
jgi:hypothetical protein